MKRSQAFYVILAVEIITVILASVGIVEREAVLAMTGLMVFYFIFSKVEDSLILFIISIPLFIALPITGYDSMANWRILLAILFLVWLSKKSSFNLIKNFKKSRLALFVSVFLFIGFISLFVATDIVTGIKKILFLVNIFLLFPIIIDIAKSENQRLKIIKAGAVAGIISLIVGYGQLISIFFKPLYTFWQWWAKNVISVFYGTNLSELLAKSNTWFSYYSDSPPTLRMFSVFPDSHSFALFAIISLIFFVYLLGLSKFLHFPRSPQRGELRDSPSLIRCPSDTMPARAHNPFRNLAKPNFWILTALSFLALVFSGSRGVWLSAAIPFLAVIYLLILKKQKVFKPFFVMLIIFVLAFPASSLIMSKSYQGETDSALAFKRAKTITDLEELSVKSRIGIWQASFQSILKHPILGVGIGNYPVVLDEDISAAKRGASAHNLYLDVASEMGSLGLIVLLLIFWQIFKKSLRQPAFVFFILWILIYNLFDVVLLNDKVLLFFMVASALLYGKE